MTNSYSETQKQEPSRGGHYVKEVRITRDARIPIVEGDDDFECGWQCIPLRPTDDDDDWQLAEDQPKDYKSIWVRWHWVEGSA
jgi:hypothetical protein